MASSLSMSPVTCVQQEEVFLNTRCPQSKVVGAQSNYLSLSISSPLASPHPGWSHISISYFIISVAPLSPSLHCVVCLSPCMYCFLWEVTHKGTALSTRGHSTKDFCLFARNNNPSCHTTSFMDYC